jgi:sigma-B regulation protein RsbU (phosphoserine phosphatase)
VPQCDLDGESRSCDAVGGDYHDYHWDGQRLSIAVADVSGKGLGAAMLMASLRTAVHAHWRDTSLASVAVLINRTFFENVPVDRYATCFLSRFDPRSGHLSYVSAGHPPTLLVRAAGSVEVLREGGPGLGLFDAVEFEEGQAALHPGDTLIAYSDGVSESWPTPEDAEGHMVSLARKHAAAPVSALRRDILTSVDRQNAGVRKDDCTVVVLRWSPPAVPAER